jgi:predicted dehydrogenase
VTVGVIGLGPWGSRIARVLAELPQVQLRWLCDGSAENRLTLKRQFPAVRFTARTGDLVDDEMLDAVVLATPVATRQDLASKLLDAEKHLLLKRVLALRGDDADDLQRRAQRSHRRLVVAHTLLHHPAVRRLRELMISGHLGEIYNLGCIRSQKTMLVDEDVVWKLGADEISVILHLLEDEPIEVFAHGDAFAQPDVADVAVCYLRFATGISVSLQLSCIDPLARRTLGVIGSEAAALVDFGWPERALTIHERGSDVVSPWLSGGDPLRSQCEQFVQAVRLSRHASKGVREARRVVRVLEAIQLSLNSGKGQRLIDEPLEPDVAPVVALSTRSGGRHSRRTKAKAGGTVPRTRD